MEIEFKTKEFSTYWDDDYNKHIESYQIISDEINLSYIPFYTYDEHKIYVYNALSNDDPYLTYSTSSKKWDWQNGTHPIIRNGFAYKNFIEDIGIKDPNGLLKYIEDNNMSNTDFYFMRSKEVYDIYGLCEDDCNTLNESLSEVRKYMDSRIMSSYFDS